MLNEIERIVDGKAIIIDPAKAVAKRTQDLLKEHNILNSSEAFPVKKFFINGKKLQLTKLLKKISTESFEVNFDIKI